MAPPLSFGVPTPVVFVFGCLGVRAALTYVAEQYYASKWIPLLALFCAAVGFGMLFLWATGGRRSAPESSAPDGKVWWDSLRPVHGLLWLFAGIALSPLSSSKTTQMLVGPPSAAWYYLGLDTLLGAVAYLVYLVQ
jgi:hypothetical protein